MRKTEMIKVYFPGWQLWIFSLTINLIVLAIQPLSTVAQVEISQLDSKQAANTNTSNTALEPEILSEINRVRTNPQDYAQWLQEQRQYYDGIWLKLPGEKPVRTNKGQKALEEAIAFLKEQQPLAPLAASSQTAATASSELENFANANNIQYFSYGRKTAEGIVMDLVVDELFPDRRRRQSLLSPEAENTGVVCKPDPRYAKVCAIAYSDSPNTNVAEAKPDPPTISDSEIASSPEVKPNTNTDVADSNPQPTPEPTSESQETPAKLDENSAESSDNSAIVTLPVPPQLQTPPTPAPSTSSQSQESEVESKSAEDLQIAQAELEIEQEQKELSQDESAESDESELSTAAEDNNDEVKIESEIAQVLEDTPEVATNLENSGIQEKVERGTLEEGDRIISDDGSLYDFYPIQGRKGESFTIYLESDEFDAFVALVDSNGNTVGENDDISQSDSNSKISVTLPEDGIYNVIVNTYDEEGKGEYILTVSR